MLLRHFLASLAAFLSLTTATPQNFLPSDAPTCHGKPICCQKFFTGSTAPFPLPYNLACLDLRPTDLQCIYSATSHLVSLSSCCLRLLISGSQPTSPSVTEPGPAASSTSHPSRCNALHRPASAAKGLPSRQRVWAVHRCACGIVSGVIRRGRWRIW